MHLWEMTGSAGSWALLFPLTLKKSSVGSYASKAAGWHPLSYNCAFSFQIIRAVMFGFWMETYTIKACWSLPFLQNPCKTPLWSLLRICLDLGLLWSLYRNGPVSCKNILISWKFLRKRWETWNRGVSLCASLHNCFFFLNLSLATFFGND